MAFCSDIPRMVVIVFESAIIKIHLIKNYKPILVV
jgi:hypothetical protein